MQIMTSYLDMITEMEILKDQIAMTKKELKYWFGIDLDTEDGVPLSGKGSHKFGAMAAIIQADKKVSNFQKLTKRLTELEHEKARLDELMDKFEGLDYKIAYKRIVESKTHQEIADELGYEEQTIRKRWSRHKQSTDKLKNA